MVRPALFCLSVAPISATTRGFSIVSSLDLRWLRGGMVFSG
jgi:hypothetical protein